MERFGGRSPWRWTAATAAVVGAAAHLTVAGARAAGPGWLLLAPVAALPAVAVALVLWDSPVVWTLAGAVAVSSAAYGLYRWVGVPPAGGAGGRAGLEATIALAAEALLALLALAAVPAHRRAGAGTPRPGPRPLRWSAAALVIGLVASGCAAAAGTGGTGEGSSANGPMTGSGYWRQVAGGDRPAGGVVRHYYISADPVVWNYVPTGRDQITGAPFDTTARTYTASGPGRIGPRYVKCLYRGYTDASFRHRLPRPASQRYLGILGPVIHAAVGDTVSVVFRNACPFPTSMHPHGLRYAKNDEGAPYADGTGGSDKADDAVPTGGRHTYVWKIPGRAGPGPGDGSSVMWMYHSHTDEVADTYAGLIGPIVVTRAGMARADGTPKDVDQEVFADFFIDNEALSPLLKENERRFGTPPMPADPGDDDEFAESNLKHSINGYLYGNMPMITLHRGAHVRWYLMGMGTETDLHTPHWHGNDVTVSGMRTDVVDLLPAGMVVADMVPDNPGTWLFHCHVNDHITAGMQARYRVTR